MYNISSFLRFLAWGRLGKTENVRNFQIFLLILEFMGGNGYVPYGVQ